MKTVYKYPLGPVGDWVSIAMPLGAEVLCVQVQHGEPFLWAKVDPSEPRVRRNFRVAGTGHVLGGAADDYVGSFQLSGGDLVFHVFAESAS